MVPLAIYDGVHQIREPSFDRNYKLGLGMYLLTDGEAALIDSGIAASPSNCIFPGLEGSEHLGHILGHKYPWA